MGYRFLPFVITAEEAEFVLEPFTLFKGNCRVERDYIYTPKSEFIENYTKLFCKLCAGEKIHYAADVRLLEYFCITTDIDSLKWRFFENGGAEYKIYECSDRGPVPYLCPFTFSVYEENDRICVSTRGSWVVDYTDIMGFQMVCAADTEDFKAFKDRLFKCTSALKLNINGSEKRTQIRVSITAREKLKNFHCIKNGHLEVKL